MTDYPSYLRDVPPGGHTYGTLSYNRRSKCSVCKIDLPGNLVAVCYGKVNKLFTLSGADFDSIGAIFKSCIISLKTLGHSEAFFQFYAQFRQLLTFPGYAVFAIAAA